MIVEQAMSPILLLSICFSAGIGLGLSFPVPLAHGACAAVACAGLIIVALAARRRAGLCLMTTALILGWIRVPVTTAPRDSGAPCVRVVEGRAAEPPVALEEGFRAVMEITGKTACSDGAEIGDMVPARGTLYLRLSEKPKNLRRGDRVRVRGRISPIRSSRNPGAPHFQNNAPVFAATLSAPSLLVKTGVSSFYIRSLFDEKRAALSAFLDAALDPSVAAVAKALALGETTALDFETKNHFRRAGCAHLLAVSGLHLGLAAALIFIGLRRALLFTPLAAKTDTGRIAAFFAVFPTVAFTLITGCRTPQIRACVMACAALFARVQKRPQGSVEALFAAAVAVLCVSPSSLKEAGFQLSFAAAAGFLFVFSRREKENAQSPDKDNGRLQKIYLAFARLLRATLAASAVSWPLTLLHFGSVSWISPLTNLIAVPLVSFFLLPLLFLTLLVESISPSAAAWMLRPAAGTIEALCGFLKWVSNFPCTLESPGFFASAAVVGCSVAIFFALCFLLRKRTAALACIALIFFAALADSPKIAPGKLTVHFLDVGQGDSALITSPKGRHILMDGGPAGRGGFDAGERIVVPALRALGVSSIHIVAAGHPDSDHIGGLKAVLEAFDVKQLFDNGQGRLGKNSRIYPELIRAAKNRGIPIMRPPTICGVHEFDGATFEIISPCEHPGGFDPSASTNDNSLVMLLRYKDVSLLLLGDISKATETKLVEQGRIPKVDVIKSAHHGSKTSTGAVLLDAAAPAFDVISAGAYNRFGMPHLSVLKRLSERHIRTLRTDKKGTILFRTDGRLIEISPFVPPN